MLNEQTIATMNALKLFGMAKGFTQRLDSVQHAPLSHDEFVGMLVSDEKTYRDNQRLKRLLANARLKQQAAMEDIDYKHPRGLNKQVMLELSSAEWIRSCRNVLLVGPTGVGKSYIACALGNLAARTGYSCFYVRSPRLFETLEQAQADGSHLKMLTKLAKIQVLIMDDFLLTAMSDRQRQDFLEIIEDRYGSAATVITSQCPIKDWHQAIGDPTLADAICDRLLHNAYKIEIKGDSIRKKSKT